MRSWKVNLTVLWFGQFMIMAGMTMIMPFLALYIQELGITNEQSVNFWAGIIFAANFITVFMFQPFWGKLADQYGRKVMILRSGFGMSIVMVLMGFSTSVWHLLLLRMLNGTISGFIPAATALISASTPKKHAGFAMGILQSGSVAGTILGPLIGGFLAEVVGFAPIFYITGSLVFLATLLCLFFVHEDFDKKKAASQPKIGTMQSLRELWKIPQLPALYAVTFMIQFAILSSMPQLPVFIQQMHGNVEYLALLAGLVGAVTGISNMIASPMLGRLGDRIGSTKILATCIIGAAICFIPQAFVQSVWQLLIARFVFGCFVGGLLPSVNALIRQFTPDEMVSRSYGFNSSSLALGNMIGPTFGGIFAAFVGIREIFLVASAMLIINGIWVWLSLIRPAARTNAD